MKRLVIVGASGMVGGCALRYALLNSWVDSPVGGECTLTRYVLLARHR